MLTSVVRFAHLDESNRRPVTRGTEWKESTLSKYKKLTPLSFIKSKYKKLSPRTYASRGYPVPMGQRNSVLREEFRGLIAALTSFSFQVIQRGPLKHRTALLQRQEAFSTARCHSPFESFQLLQDYMPRWTKNKKGRLSGMKKLLTLFLFCSLPSYLCTYTFVSRWGHPSSS